MPQLEVRGVRLYYEEHGDGRPIVLIHGVSTSALIWGQAVDELARLGRVIIYDRRGCTRSERPSPYETTNVAEHADDAAELLLSLAATPAVVIGRSYGGEVALDLALRYPELVRALVLLEAAPVNLSPAADAFLRGVAERVFAAAEESGHGAAGEVLVRGVSGEWEALPEPLREMITANGPAILAEFSGSFLHDGSFKADQEVLAMIEAPTLVVSAADSRQAFRQADEALAASLPNARRALVKGGHLISPADPAVIQFVKEVLRPLD